GELYCTESQFIKLTEEMVALGLERPTSPRNIVAGMLGRKSQIHLSHYFNFFSFDVLSDERSLQFKTEMEKFAWLQKHGFRLPEPELLKGREEIEMYLDRVKQLMSEDEVQMDGAVFSYDDLAAHKDLGFTAHHPRYKMSFKWQGQTAVAKIDRIEWATSRLGV